MQKFAAIGNPPPSMPAPPGTVVALTRARRACSTALLVAMLTAGCSGTHNRPAPTTTAATAGTTTTNDPNTAVVAAYRAYWADLIDAGKTADWESPRLDDHATGEGVAVARDNYRQLRAQGLVVRGTVSLHPRVVAIRGDTATIEDCTDVTKFLRRDAKTGKAAEPEVRDVRRTVVTLKRISGRWLVSNSEAKGQCAK